MEAKCQMSISHTGEGSVKHELFILEHKTYCMHYSHACSVMYHGTSAQCTIQSSPFLLLHVHHCITSSLSFYYQSFHSSLSPPLPFLLLLSFDHYTHRHTHTHTHTHTDTHTDTHTQTHTHTHTHTHACISIFVKPIAEIMHFISP